MPRKTASMRAQRTAQKNKKRQNFVGDNVISRFGLPSRYPLPTNDVVPANFKFSFIAYNTAEFQSRVALVYGNGTTSGSTLYMSTFCAGFGSLSLIYSRFLIKRLKLEMRQITPLTEEGFGIANYEATASSSAGPPANLADVANAVHTLETSPGRVGSFVVTPTDYYNDWRVTYGDGELTSTPDGCVTVLDWQQCG
jgi:hypothetical protein